MAAARGPGTAVARWQLLRPLGTGSQSEVRLARCGEQIVALKPQPLPGGPGLAAAAEAFVHAAELSRGLQHPAIVAVWEAGLAGADGALAWLAMEPLRGVDLQRCGREPRLLPEPVVLRVLERVAAALAHAHARGVLHRDLKPAAGPEAAVPATFAALRRAGSPSRRARPRVCGLRLFRGTIRRLASPPEDAARADDDRAPCRRGPGPGAQQQRRLGRRRR